MNLKRAVYVKKTENYNNLKKIPVTSENRILKSCMTEVISFQKQYSLCVVHLSNSSSAQSWYNQHTDTYPTVTGNISKQNSKYFQCLCHLLIEYLRWARNFHWNAQLLLFSPNSHFKDYFLL